MAEELAGLAAAIEAANPPAAEPAAPAVNAESAPAPQAATDPADGEKQDKGRDPQAGMMREIARTRERARQAERARQESEAKFNALLERVLGGQGVQGGQQRQPEGPPQRAQFRSDEEYIDARADFKARETARALLAEQAKQTEAGRRAQEARSLADSWGAKVEKAQAKYADWADVTDRDDVPVSDAMQAAIMDSDVGADIVYHLGKHPEEAARIAALPPLRQAKEIGRLEARFSEQQPAANKQVSKAPPPISPVGGAAQADPASLSEELSMADWIKRRSAQVHRKR